MTAAEFSTVDNIAILNNFVTRPRVYTFIVIPFKFIVHNLILFIFFIFFPRPHK